MAKDQIDQIRLRADELRNDPAVTPRPGALSENFSERLSDAGDIPKALIELLRDRSVVETQAFEFPRKPGPGGSVMYYVRAFLWKLLRYQHDRMSSRQNRINALIISALEQRTEALQLEVNALKKKMSQQEGNDR